MYKDLFDEQFENLMSSYSGETLADKIATMFLTGGETAVSTLMTQMSLAMVNAVANVEDQPWYDLYELNVQSVIKQVGTEQFDYVYDAYAAYISRCKQSTEILLQRNS